MTAGYEPRPTRAGDGRDGQGQKDMPKEVQRP
jgi:hypothetical protein